MDQKRAYQLYNSFKDKIETNDYGKQISDLLYSIQAKFKAIIKRVEEDEISRAERLKKLKQNVQEVLNQSWMKLQAYSQGYYEKIQERNETWPQVDAKMQAFFKIKTIFKQQFMTFKKSKR